MHTVTEANAGVRLTLCAINFMMLLWVRLLYRLAVGAGNLCEDVR